MKTNRTSKAGSLPATLLALATGLTCAVAEVAPVAIDIPDPEAWSGQRIPMHVELRAPGSFSGAAWFDLPQIPGALIMKVGNPLVSSKDLEGSQWAIQRHEFAIFSQKPGTLEIPGFPVRFGVRDGFTGPATELEETVPAAKVEIKRPPGSEDIGFLITTESLSIRESWDPPPGPAMVGDVFKRTIVQSAPQMTGMALAPAPDAAPDGIRVYPPESETNDNFQRGEFLGGRTDTLTYLLRQPGTFTLPALKYVWWNPESETLESKTLPAVTFEVAPPPARPADTGGAPATRWLWLLIPAILAGAAFWKRRTIRDATRRLRIRLNPPDRVAARALLRACRTNDALSASAAWNSWRNLHPNRELPDELRREIHHLEKQCFGKTPPTAWTGSALAKQFRMLSKPPAKQRTTDSALPALNPPES